MKLVQLIYILKKDTGDRASAYHLAKMYQDLEYAKKFDDQFKEGIDFKDMIGEERFQQVKKDYCEYEGKMMRIINSSKSLSKINLLRNKKVKKNKYLKWYNICDNISTLKQLSREAEWESYHDSLYGTMSLEAHGYNATRSIGVREDGFYMQQIRLPINAGTLFELTCVFSVSVLQDIYSYIGWSREDLLNFKVFYEDFMQYRNQIKSELDEIKVVDDTT